VETGKRLWPTGARDSGGSNRSNGHVARLWLRYQSLITDYFVSDGFRVRLRVGGAVTAGGSVPIKVHAPHGVTSGSGFRSNSVLESVHLGYGTVRCSQIYFPRNNLGT